MFFQTGMLATETSQLAEMVISVVRCERQYVPGEFTEHTVRNTHLLSQLLLQYDHFTKTGSGQT
jgi:hypothetical protein